MSELTPNPKNSPLGPKMAQNDEKSQVNQTVRIEDNLGNDSYSCI